VEPELKNLRDSGWKPYGQREFKFFNIKYTWEEAEEDCMQYEAHLASVHDGNENRFIKLLIKSQTGQNSPTWIGGYNSPAVPSRWYWTDDSPFDYSQWATGEPDGSGNCLQINYYGTETTGGWDDLDCIGNLPFVCVREIKKGVFYFLSIL
ncbi:hypothetical protein NFI96_032940, partial [Prochilodus magdalenae]